MCVEAAVCYAMGLPHSDKPTCVGTAVRAFKIRINDARWSSDKARTEGLRRLAVAQLGSDGIDQAKFVRIVVEQTLRQIVPRALRAAKLRNPAHSDKLEAAAAQCERDGDHKAALNAKSAAAAAYDAAAAAYAADAAVTAAASYAAAAAAYAAAAVAAAAAAYAAAAVADDDDAYDDDAYDDAYDDDAVADAGAAYAYAAADADAAYAATYAAAAAAAAADAVVAYAAAAAAARDEVLELACNIALAALVELQSPGCAYLHLCD
jgi:hypothetical protein